MWCDKHGKKDYKYFSHLSAHLGNVLPVLHMLVTSDMYRTDVACMQRWGGPAACWAGAGTLSFPAKHRRGDCWIWKHFLLVRRGCNDVCSHDMKECRIEPVFESSVRACLPRMTRRVRRITKSCDAGLDIIVYRAPRLKIMLVMLHFKFIFGVRQHGWVLGFSWISFDGGKTVVCH
jgi:hypothetical protein